MNHVFLVMEYFDSDLKKLLINSGKLAFSEEHVVTIMYNVLCALNMVHTSNIMHRDIKPANILVNETCRVRLCDFGLSRPVPDNLLIPTRENVTRDQ